MKYVPIVNSENKLEALSSSELQTLLKDTNEYISNYLLFYDRLRTQILDLEKFNIYIHRYNHAKSYLETVPFTTLKAKTTNKETSVNDVKQYLNLANTCFRNLHKDLEQNGIFQHIEENKSKPSQITIDTIKSDLSSIYKEQNEELLKDIKKGIDKLNEYKESLGIKNSFGKNIEQRKNSSSNSMVIYFWFFVASMLAISVLIIFSFFYDSIQSMDIYNKIGIRLAVIPLGVLSYILFSQYKLQFMLNLKYVHLHDLINGGIIHLSELVTDDEEAKKAKNQRISEIFLEIDNTLDRVKNTKHPIKDAKEKTLESINTTLVTLSEVIKNIKDIKP